MIVDTHVHFGIWSGGKQFTPIDELLAESAAAGVDRIVQVTNSAAKWDNGPSLEGAAQHPDRILGVIGRFDPTAPDVEARLRACMTPDPMLGIRLQLRGKSETWLADGTLDPTLAAAEKLGTTVQLYASFQVPAMHERVRRFPGVRFLIDHMGVRHESASDSACVFRQWPELFKLADEPNVWTKVSLFPEAVHGRDEFPFPTAQHFFKSLYEHAGAKKLIWGSNYPPVAGTCTYKQSLEFVRDHCTFLNDTDRAAILGGTFLEQFATRRIT